MSESGVLKSLENDFKRSHFFADEQNTLALCNEFRNQICDRLALSGTWRPLNYQTASCFDCFDANQLAAIRVSDKKAGIGQNPLVKVARFRRFASCRWPLLFAQTSD